MLTLIYSSFKRGKVKPVQIISVFIFLSAVTILVAFVRAEFGDTMRQSEHYTVIVLAGQSNMSGMDQQNETFDPEILYDGTRRFVNLRDETNMLKRGIGPSIGMMQCFAKNRPEEHLIFITFSVGGSNLDYWHPDRKASPYWLPRLRYREQIGTFYEILVMGIKEVVGDQNVTYGALVWMQGESDSRELELAKNYRKNFDRFFLAFKKDLGVDDLPLILGRVNPPKTTYGYCDIVRKHQSKIAHDYLDAVLVDTDDLEKMDDDLHYTAAADVVLGKRFYDAYMHILENKK